MKNGKREKEAQIYRRETTSFLYGLTNEQAVKAISELLREDIPVEDFSGLGSFDTTIETRFGKFNYYHTMIKILRYRNAEFSDCEFYKCTKCGAIPEVCNTNEYIGCAERLRLLRLQEQKQHKTI